jgi:hypothetical protein
MSDLDETEQKHVRTALRFLRTRLGTWACVAEALRMSPRTLEKVTGNTGRVTASIALRVARLAGTTVDDLISGNYLPGACPRCGHIRDFVDDQTMVHPVHSWDNFQTS